MLRGLSNNRIRIEMLMFGVILTGSLPAMQADLVPVALVERSLWKVELIVLALLVGAIFLLLLLWRRALGQPTIELEAEVLAGEELSQRLAESETRFQSFLANSSEHLWCVEFDEPISLALPEEDQVEQILVRGRYVEANAAFASAYGATVEEVIGWKLEKTLPRSHAETVPFLLSVVRSGYRMEEVETLEVDQSGQGINILNSFVPTIEDGKVLRVWGMARDVTERRAREEENLIRSVALETLGDGCVIADALGKDFPITYVNDQFCRLTGWEREEVLGRNCRFLQGEGTSAQSSMAIRVAVDAGLPFDGEILNYKKGGESFWNRLRISPVHNSAGDLTHFVAIQSDVSELKKKEKLIIDQRDELAHVSRVATMGVFTAAFAHELSQPLAATLRNAEAARRMLEGDRPDLGEVRVILDDIIRDDRRAGEVLEGIRQHLRKKSTQSDRLDVNGVIRSTLKLLPSGVTASSTIELVLTEELPPISGDAVQLQQVVINLVTNASEAMSAGKRGRIIVATRNGPEGMVLIEVTDEGEGIGEGQLESVFDPFFTTKKEGMGMGLAIDKTIVEAHHGSIWAENRDPGGARISFTLPVFTEQES